MREKKKPKAIVNVRQSGAEQNENKSEREQESEDLKRGWDSGAVERRMEREWEREIPPISVVNTCIQELN